MADVTLEGVTKRFGRNLAVDDLSLIVKDGEFLVLLGPTGAGKTTTLRLVAGLEKPDAGLVKIGGVDMTARPPADRDVAFVFQQYSLYPHYSVFDNLASPLRSPLRRWPEDAIKKRVDEVSALLRIESKLQNRATQLSGVQVSPPLLELVACAITVHARLRPRAPWRTGARNRARRRAAAGARARPRFPPRRPPAAAARSRGRRRR